LLPRAAKLFEPARKDGRRNVIDINEFNAHPNAWLDDAHRGKSLDFLTLAGERDAGARFEGERPAGANEATAQRDIRSDSVGVRPGFEVQEFGIGGEGEANGITTIAEGSSLRCAFRLSVIHGDKVVHRHIDRGKAVRTIGGAFPVRAVCLKTVIPGWIARCVTPKMTTAGGGWSARSLETLCY